MKLCQFPQVSFPIISIVFLLLLVPCTMAEFKSLVPHKSEADAAALGKKLDIGSARLEGPLVVEALTHQTWTLVYTAGKAGISPGGGIRIAVRHVVEWTTPQTEDPKSDGYLTANTSDNSPVHVAIIFSYKDLFQQYHPWQNIVEMTFSESGLKPGETLRVTYGDRSGGSPGIRIQPFDESPFVFRLYVDALGNGDYLPMINNPKIEIAAAEPYRLGVVMPSDAVMGKPAWCTVRAEDRYGNPTPKYRGIIRLLSTDSEAKLPQAHSFTEADRGAYRFENIVFNTAGYQTITATDGTFQQRSNPVRIAEKRPKQLLLWGDLHGHTLHSDGRGTVEQYYDFAERVAALDFCAVSDHGFEMLDEMWAHSKEVTNKVNKPGRFVTFQAYEWSGQGDVGGDHNVYFLDDDPPLYRSRSYYNYLNFQMYHGPEPQVNHIEDLFLTLEGRLKDKKVLCIPHWGGRHGNPEWHNPRVQRMIEVFSEHRRSEDWMTTFLKRGYRLGIMASTDDHFGNPGYGYLKPSYDWPQQEIGMALVAVYAEKHTRESIFRALYNRHVYATSGDRIILDVRADGHVMGSEYTTRKSPTITVSSVGTAPIQMIEIKKNCETVYSKEQPGAFVELEWQDPEFNPDQESYYYVRILQINNEEAISSPIWIN
ncbi:MAG: DUF3604 domain-containing protein [bacterium]